MTEERERHTKRAKGVVKLTRIATRNLRFVVHAASHGYVRRAWAEPDKNGPGVNADDEVRRLLRDARTAIDGALSLMKGGGLD